MFNPNSNLRTTLQLEPTELAAFLAVDERMAKPAPERQTLRVSYAEMSDILFQDTMKALENEHFEVEVVQ